MRLYRELASEIRLKKPKENLPYCLKRGGKGERRYIIRTNKNYVHVLPGKVELRFRWDFDKHHKNSRKPKRILKAIFGTRRKMFSILFREQGGIAVDAREKSEATLLLLCVIRGAYLSWEGQNKHYLKKTATKRMRAKSHFKVTHSSSSDQSYFKNTK